MTDLQTMSRLAVAVALAQLTARAEEENERQKAAERRDALCAWRQGQDLPPEVLSDLIAYLEEQQKEQVP
jgi:hypothetical protein